MSTCCCVLGDTPCPNSVGKSHWCSLCRGFVCKQCIVATRDGDVPENGDFGMLVLCKKHTKKEFTRHLDMTISPTVWEKLLSEDRGRTPSKDDIEGAQVDAKFPCYWHITYPNAGDEDDDQESSQWFVRAIVCKKGENSFGIYDEQMIRCYKDHINWDHPRLGLRNLWGYEFKYPTRHQRAALETSSQPPRAPPSSSTPASALNSTSADASPNHPDSSNNQPQPMTKREKRRIAVLEVVNMTQGTHFYFDAIALAMKEGCESIDIKDFLELHKESAPRRESTDQHVPHDMMDESHDDPPSTSYEKYVELVCDDVKQLRVASTEGKVSICSWKADDDKFVTVTPLPVCDDIVRDNFRCEFLTKIMPREYITLIHNGIVAYFMLSSYGITKEWYTGFNANSSAYNFDFFGDQIKFYAKELFKEVHGEELFLDNNDPTLLYRDFVPSYSELEGIIGVERLEELRIRCQVNGICDLRQFLDDNRGRRDALLPGLWLSWKALITSPHLFRVFDEMLQEWKARKEAEKNDQEEAAGGEDDAGNEAINNDDGNNNNKNNNDKKKSKRKRSKPKFRNYYKEFVRDSTGPDGIVDVSELVRKCEEYLQEENGIMDMLQGKCEGALKEWETKGNNYATVNIIHAIEFFLTSRDRFNDYEKDDVFEVKVITGENMKDAGAVAFANPPNMERKVRMPIAAFFDQSIMIKPGKDDRPISGMTGVVYLDDQLNRCTTEVHRIIIK